MKRVRERMRARNSDVSRDEILAITDYFSMGLFMHDDGDKRLIADVLHAYVSAASSGAVS